MSAFRGSSGLFFSFALILVTTEMIFGHIERILNSNSFAACFRSFNLLATQRVNVLQTVDLCVLKTSWGIPFGVGGSGRSPIESADPEGRGWGRGGQQEGECEKLFV